MYFNVTDAVYIENYKIRLSFTDGKSGIVDLSEYIMTGEIFKSIRTAETFIKFKVEFGTLTWEDGEIDIAPETLYVKATGDAIIFDSVSIQRVG